MPHKNNEISLPSVKDLVAKLPLFDGYAALMVGMGIALAIAANQGIGLVLDSVDKNRAEAAAAELSNEILGAVKRNEVVLGSCSSINKERLAIAARVSPLTQWGEPWTGVFHDQYVEVSYPLNESRFPEQNAAYILEKLEGEPGISAIKLMEGDVVVTYDCKNL